ncbi:HTH domain-containing protein [Vreelandella andesensis]|uniref:HTH domain-containing protein n=1 Tax=Vreelandella andesensis TaxID=447567 RepID=A0A3S0W2Z0_9GAMM|nr:glutathione S-transferase N-terminal domain-containing protein [Halomonas andesensis]RUR26660.1 HTH domain-containing protein [Halomonas andesensis]
MSQTNRLPRLLKMLRHYDDPVSGADLAEALGIPLSALYKDIAVLRAVGVEIISEPGQGYVLPPSVQLPPPALSEPAVAQSAELIFYTHPLSRGGIVHWMLEELGVPYRLVALEYGATMHSPDYLAINPMGKVPAIRHGERVITEAAAICAYLADAFPEAGLAPPLSERGNYYRWLFFAAGPLEAAASLYSLGVQPNAEQRMRLGSGDYTAVIDSLAAAVDGRRYIAGDAFSAADVYVGSHIGWGMQFETLPRRPEFEQYWAGLQDRPARQHCEMFVQQALAR